MDQLLTANVATNMYWLGRYLERAETALYKIEEAFNLTIDVDKSAGVKLYKKLGIELEYTNSADFLKKAIYGDHTANIMTITSNARESAIISRIYINNSAFGEIIELDALFKRKSNDADPIDYKDLDHALSLIKEIWGETASRKKQSSSDYFFKLGRLVEELDICLRFNRDFEILKQIIDEINVIFKILNPELDLVIDTIEDSSDINMDKIHNLVEKLIVED
ncbi:alpha-E domain-containing protein [Arcobacter peruensis]|uniref:alpha-E domain-containing protein n=1 Tax=Arcobacter peruensis TaxID=2320140 RepID=UPI000F08CC86|nr:alpha-E domain-containing protein [Arcobacter peruensis]